MLQHYRPTRYKLYVSCIEPLQLLRYFHKNSVIHVLCTSPYTGCHLGVQEYRKNTLASTISCQTYLWWALNGQYIHVYKWNTCMSRYNIHVYTTLYYRFQALHLLWLTANELQTHSLYMYLWPMENALWDGSHIASHAHWHSYCRDLYWPLAPARKKKKTYW